MTARKGRVIESIWGDPRWRVVMVRGDGVPMRDKVRWRRLLPLGARWRLVEDGLTARVKGLEVRVRVKW